MCSEPGWWGCNLQNEQVPLKPPQIRHTSDFELIWVLFTSNTFFYFFKAFYEPYIQSVTFKAHSLVNGTYMMVVSHDIKIDLKGSYHLVTNLNV